MRTIYATKNWVDVLYILFFYFTATGQTNWYYLPRSDVDIIEIFVYGLNLSPSM